MLEKYTIGVFSMLEKHIIYTIVKFLLNPFSYALCGYYTFFRYNVCLEEYMDLSPRLISGTKS